MFKFNIDLVPLTSFFVVRLPTVILVLPYIYVKLTILFKKPKIYIKVTRYLNGPSTR